MADWIENSLETELSFNIDDWVNGLFPEITTDSSNDRMESTEVPVPSSSSLSNPNQQSKAIDVAGNYQLPAPSGTSLPKPKWQTKATKVTGNAAQAESSLPNSKRQSKAKKIAGNATQAGTSVSDSNRQSKRRKMRGNCYIPEPASNMNHSMRSPMYASDSPNNLVQQSFPCTTPTMFNRFPQNQTPRNVAFQVQPHSIFQHQSRGLHTYPFPVQPNSHLSNRSQIQQQPVQNLNTSPRMLQQHESFGYQSNLSVTRMRYRESINFLQQADQTMPQKWSEQILKQMHMQHALGSQSGLRHEVENLKSLSSDFPQYWNLISADQNISEGNSLAALPGLSQAVVDSNYQAKSANANDWVAEALRKVLEMKQIYSSDVDEFHKGVLKWRKTQKLSAESLASYEEWIRIIEDIFKFFNLSCADISGMGKETFLQNIKGATSCIEKFIALNAREVGSTSGHIKVPQLQQSNGNIIQFCGTQSSIPESMRQQGPSSLETNSVNSFQVGSTRTSRSSQGSVKSVTHNASQIGLDQRGFFMLPNSGIPGDHHNRMWSPQQKITQSPNIHNPSVSPITRNSVPMPSQKNKRLVQETDTLNIKKPVQHFLTDENMRQIMQKKNEELNLRNFTGSDKKSQNSSKNSECTTPSVFQSPLNPPTPSSKQSDSEKSLLSIATPVALAELPLQEKDQPSTDLQELTKFSLGIEPTCPGQKESSLTKEDPLERLINVVKSMSSEALNSSLREMADVINMSDRITVNFVNGEGTRGIVEDLAADIRNYKDGMFGSGVESRMKRRLNAICSTNETELLCTGGMMKREKKQPNDRLLQEIEGISRKLMEVVLKARAGREEGTYSITCSYHPIGLNRNAMVENISPNMFPSLILELTVKADYPHSSPIVAERIPPCFNEAEEGKEMWMKAKSNFSLSLAKFSQPISLEDVAKTGGFCAREVFKEFASLNGGGDFSSKYGKWENCVAA